MGLEDGHHQSMAASGSVVTSAGLVFAFTMISFAVSDLHVPGQVARLGLADEVSAVHHNRSRAAGSGGR